LDELIKKTIGNAKELTAVHNSFVPQLKLAIVVDKNEYAGAIEYHCIMATPLHANATQS
jgi:hypothetical protein